MNADHVQNGVETGVVGREGSGDRVYVGPVLVKQWFELGAQGSYGSRQVSANGFEHCGGGGCIDCCSRITYTGGAGQCRIGQGVDVCGARAGRKRADGYCSAA